MEMSGIKKKMTITICILFIVFSLASVIYYRSLDCLPFIIGALLGCAVSIAKVILLARAVDKSLEKDTKTAGNYVRLQHFLRLLLTGAVLLLAALVPGINLWGAAAGVLSFQVAIYLLKFTYKA